MLSICDIHTYYGKSHILQGVSLEVEAGECVVLLGSNGMGRSTILKFIMGLVSVRQGSIQFKGKSINREKPFRIAQMGIGYVPEDRGIFAELTVHENLRIPYKNLPKKKHSWMETLDLIYELFPILEVRSGQMAGNMSGGEQQMLSTARALILGTDIILMDEPTEGLAPMVVQTLTEVIRKIRQTGRTILLVEQNLQTAAKMADRYYLLEKGRIIQNGIMDESGKQLDSLSQILGVN